MRKKIVLLLFLAAIFLNAQERMALILGNGNYQSPHGRLENVSKDIEIMKKALESVGFSIFLGQDMKIQEMKDKVENFIQEMKKRNPKVVLVYYAGHGIQVDSKQYLLPLDMPDSLAKDFEKSLENKDYIEFIKQPMRDRPIRPSEEEMAVEVRRRFKELLLTKSSLPTDYIIKHLDTRDQRVNIVILNACRKNGDALFAEMGKGEAIHAPEIKGMFVAYTTSPGEAAYNHTIFAESFAEFVKEDMNLTTLMGEIGTRLSKTQNIDFTNKLNRDFYFFPPLSIKAMPEKISGIKSTVEKQAGNRKQQWQLGGKVSFSMKVSPEPEEVWITIQGKEIFAEKKDTKWEAILDTVAFPDNPYTIVAYASRKEDHKIYESRPMQCTIQNIVPIPPDLNRLALVIGNARYQYMSKLKNPENDAEDMANLLEKMGFSVMQRKNLGYDDMSKVIDQFITKVEEKTVFLFYYAGHGMEQDGSNYLIPIDYDAKEYTLKRRSISVQGLLQHLGNQRAFVNILFLDTCREQQARNSNKMEIIHGAGRLKNSLILYATAPGDKASDNSTERNGMFTKHILRNLKLPGKLLDISSNITDGVERETNSEQIPSCTGSFGKNLSDFCLIPKSDMEPETYGLPQEIWESCKYNHNGEWILDMASDRWVNQGFAKQVEYARAYQAGYARAKGMEIEKTISGIAMRLIPPGRFWMGSPDREKDRGSYEKRHRVIISKAFYVGKYEVTQAQWQKVMGKNPAHFQDSGSNAPVECVSWNDCQEFCKNAGVKLLTEAQWEYACRAGTTTPFNLGENMTTDQVNYYGDYPYAGGAKGKYRGKTVVCGSLPNANAWGCYDFHGNVWEWCQDKFQEYSGDNISDPEYQNGSSCLLRGGSWNSFGYLCLSARRSGGVPDSQRNRVGLRCLCIP